MHVDGGETLWAHLTFGERTLMFNDGGVPSDAKQSAPPLQQELPCRSSCPPVVAAPLEQVWAADTTPDDLMVWNTASPDWHTTSSTVDLRPGGKCSSRMQTNDGSSGFDVSGEYTKAVPLELIECVFGERVGTVECKHAPHGVRVTVTLDSEDTHTEEQRRSGWQAFLDSFRQRVGGTGESHRDRFGPS